MTLTTRQQEIWEFVVRYVDAHGYPPTVREIGGAVGLASPSTVHAHLANLERAGLLRREALVVPVAWVADPRLVSRCLRGWREDRLGRVDYARVTRRC